MANKITYSSTISVPVYASWKCQKCNCVNTSNGTIQCQGTSTSYSFKESNLEAAKKEAAEFVEAEWKRNTLNIITDPRSFPESFRSFLNLGKVKCSNCRKTPSWTKKGSFLTVLMILAFLVGLITLYPIITGQSNFLTWLVLAVCASIVILISQSDKIFEKRIAELPEQYVPVIGTLNEEMLVYAEHYGKKIPTPEECIAIANGTLKRDL